MRYRFYDEERNAVPIGEIENELLERLEAQEHVPSLLMEYELLVLIGSYCTVGGTWNNNKFEETCQRMNFDCIRRHVYYDMLNGKYKFESYY